MGSLKKYLSLLFILFAGTLLFGLASCKPKHLDRPYGYHNLGKISEFLNPETYLDQHKLLIRRDEKGLYAMSTMCTLDLTYLVKKTEGGKVIWASTYSSSKYDSNGKVISGPSIVDLPYFELKFDSGVYGGPRDTLYAYVGKKVSPDWRLEFK